MKYFLLSCVTLVFITACHVENGYYYDLPNYNSYHEHRHHDFYPEHRHRHTVPENRHGHDKVIINHGHSRASNYGHDDKQAVIGNSSRRNSRGESTGHGHDDKVVIIGSPSANRPANVHGHF